MFYSPKPRILVDPGADGGGKGKSKQAGKKWREKKRSSSQPSMNFNISEFVYSRQLCKLSSSSRVCITVSNSPNPCRLYIRRCQTRKTFLGDCLNNFRSSSNKFPKIFKSLIFHIPLFRLGCFS